MADVDARGVDKQLAREVDRRAGAARSKVERARFRFSKRDQLRQRRRDLGEIREQHVRHFAQQHDWREVAVRIERQLRIQERIHGEHRVRGEQQRVAIGRRVGNGGCRDVARAARQVLHDDRLLPHSAQAFGQAPRVDVGSTPRRRCGYDAHRLGRKILRMVDTSQLVLSLKQIHLTIYQASICS